GSAASIFPAKSFQFLLQLCTIKLAISQKDDIGVCRNQFLHFHYQLLEVNHYFCPVVKRNFTVFPEYAKINHKHPPHGDEQDEFHSKSGVFFGGARQSRFGAITGEHKHANFTFKTLASPAA
nr:hypothetical protein [Anaerolineaceae bacterium]HPN54089.1 hypothetical protein [Anaerolineaceae bacterium]